jgi:uncharacterized membrane protein YtjA (UPF0391 family)
MIVSIRHEGEGSPRHRMSPRRIETGGAAVSGTRAREAAFWLRRRRPSRRSITERLMLYWAVVFFIIAIVAGFFGFGGIASAASGIAQVLFFVFVVVFLIALVMGLMRRRDPTV